MDQKTAMNALGITSIPEQDELKRIYREMSKNTHPDAGGSSEAFTAVKDAYDFLKNKRLTWKERQEITIQENKKHFFVMEAFFNVNFKQDALLSHLQQFSKEELFLSIKKDNAEIKNFSDYYFSYNAKIRVSNKSNTLVYFLRYNISKKDQRFPGLGGAGIDEDDALYRITIDSVMYHAYRQHKLGKRTWEYNAGKEKSFDETKLFPSKKINKMFTEGNKKKFTRKDFMLALEMENPSMRISKNSKGFFIYLFGRKEKFYFYVSRYVLFESAVYDFCNVNYIESDTKKYCQYKFLPILKLKETTEDLKIFLNILKDTIKKSEGISIENNSEKIFEILCEEIKKYKPE